MSGRRQFIDFCSDQIKKHDDLGIQSMWFAVKYYSECMSDDQFTVFNLAVNYWENLDDNDGADIRTQGGDEGEYGGTS